MKKAQVLIVDDEDFVRDSLRALLEARGFGVLDANGADAGCVILRTEQVDVVLCDMRMPGGDGNRLLQKTRDEGLDVPVLILTGVSSIAEAVIAMKSGAYDLLEKPVDPDRLIAALERALERNRLRRQVRGLRANLCLPRSGRRWIAESAAGTRVQAALAKAASSEAPVLLTGPTGVGKSVVAEEIHRASSRAGEPFVRVNCLAPEELDGGSLGRVALAEGGTLVLDEVSVLDAATQTALLGLIESGEYQASSESPRRHANVRIIATTNQRLLQQMERGAFREDLYWRLAVLGIDVPTLEARREDLALLGRALGAELGVRVDLNSADPGTQRGAVLHLQPEALELLAAYPWPGNVREYRSVLERALLARDLSGVTEGVVQLGAEEISSALDAQVSLGQLQGQRPLAALVQGASEPRADAEFRIRPQLIALERELVLAALTHTHGRRTEAAELLAVDSRNLGYYIRKHRISAGELERASRGVSPGPTPPVAD